MISISIIDVSGKNVTGQITMHFKNGTDLVQAVLTDIDTGNGNWTTWIVVANLNPNDTVYTSSMWAFGSQRLRRRIGRSSIWQVLPQLRERCPIETAGPFLNFAQISSENLDHHQLAGHESSHQDHLSNCYLSVNFQFT